MRRRWFAFLLLIIPAGPAQAATLAVPGDFATIREAVKAAAPGDTIAVAAGTYHEKVRIKALDGLTLTASGLVLLAPGAGRNAIVIRDSDGVTVEGFVISSADYAIKVLDCENTSILDNGIEETSTGIRVRGGRANVIQNNDISDLSGSLDDFGFTVGGHGVRIRRSADNEVRGNTITTTLTEPVGNGILGSRASNTLIRNNDIDGVGRNGIRLIRSPGSRVIGNDCSDTTRSGIHINRAADLVVDDNTADNNGNVGIAVFRAPGLSVTSNSADGNERFGIRVNRSDPLTTIEDLTAAGNTASGNAVADYRVGDKRE